MKHQPKVGCCTACGEEEDLHLRNVTITRDTPHLANGHVTYEETCTVCGRCGTSFMSLAQFQLNEQNRHLSILQQLLDTQQQ